MPELPEVETVVRELRPRLVGKRIVSVKVGKRDLRRPWLVEWEPCLINRRVLAIRRRGKWIIVDLDHGHRLVIHLGMTGQLTVTNADLPLAKHTHLVFGLGRAGRRNVPREQL